MKRLFVLLVTAALALVGCGDAVDTVSGQEATEQTEAGQARDNRENVQEDGTAGELTPGSDEASGEEGLTDQELADMHEVENTISQWMQSDEFQSLSDEEKSEQTYALLLGLAREGTENAPYSLIVEESILRYDDQISFTYRCGVSGGIKLTPFDPYMN